MGNAYIITVGLFVWYDAQFWLNMLMLFYIDYFTAAYV